MRRFITGVAVVALTFIATRQLRADPVYICDFDSNNANWVSGYHNYPTFDSSEVPGDYVVGSNPHSWQSVFQNMGDHTTGSGNMMIVDGDLAGTTTVWQTQPPVPVTPGLTYAISAYVASTDSDDVGSCPFPENWRCLILGNRLSRWHGC